MSSCCTSEKNFPFMFFFTLLFICGMIIERMGGISVVLKKPYAFLIKHFKLIHLLLCIPLVYLIIRTGAIATFLNSYVSANYFTTETNLAGTYINYFMYLAILLVLLIVLAIYFLMRQKKKDTKFYLFLMLYYIVLFVLVSFCYGILTQIEAATLTAQTVRVYRDIAFIVYLPQFFFLGYSVLRGIGFDIKKFNFDEDAKELEITDIDSEEFELVFGKNAYKYKRTARRFIREFKYYVLENKIAFSILAVIIVVVLGTLVYLNFGVYNRVYRQTQRISHNSLAVSVEEAMLTNLDLGGNVRDTYSMAIAVKIKNNGRSASTLDYENFRLSVSNRMIEPVLDRSANFPDLGLPYTRNTRIEAGSENVYVLVYEVDPSLINESMQLKILDSVTFEIGSVTPIYKTVRLNYEKVFETENVREVDFGKILELSDTRLGLTQIQINDYLISNSYEYSYQSCTNSICQNLKNKVVSGSSKTLLVLNRMFVLSNYTNYYEARKGSSSFVTDFLKVRYTVNDKTYTSTISNLTPRELSDTWVFEIDQNIRNAAKIDLLVNIRGKQYTMKIK